MKLTVETLVRAPLDAVWRAWTTPADIVVWNTASPDWHTTRAEVDLRVGGAFSSRMEAKDGSLGFDFAGTYTEVLPQQRIAASFGDRAMAVSFTAEAKDGADAAVRVVETFDAEPTHSIEQQQQGWQAILDSFKRHVEATAGATVGAATGAGADAATLRTSRVLAATPAAVYATFADGARLARWFGPAGFSNEFAVFDFRSGGQWTFTMIGPDGTRYANECRFGDLVPDQRFVMHHVVAPLFTLTLTLTAVDGGKTRLDWAQAFEDAATARHLQAICGPANEQNLDRLEAELARVG